MLTNAFNNVFKMFESRQSKLQKADFEGQLAAISKAQGVIEFDLNGVILKINENFATVTGYSAAEVVGQHHGMFVEPAYRNSAEYKDFWKKLANGDFDAGQYKRIAKGGREIWLQASYNPIFDLNGKPFKVVKYATETTASKQEHADFEGKLAAISKSQGVIEFDLDGNILAVNDNFENVTGYSATEIVGQHHSMFVDKVYKASSEYKAFWEKLSRGEYDAGQYQRIGKGGRKLWLQASYNPIFDLNGQPVKVVKYASDISTQKEMEALLHGQLSAIGQSLGVISFSPDGKVIEANQNFLDFLGYTEEEAIGTHHSAFVEPAYKASDEYPRLLGKAEQRRIRPGRL